MFDYREYKEQEKQYLKDNAELFEFYNPHPQSKRVGDCVKRALTKASGKDYKAVQLELNRLKKITKTKKFNDNKNWLYYVEKVLNGIKLPQYRNMKIGEFAKQHKQGTYVIACRKHLVTVHNGKIYDTWNSSYKAINRIWEVKK